MFTHTASPSALVAARFNGVDNGFLRFDHVRIPLDNMLMKNARVTPDGRFVPPPPGNQKAAYATMASRRLGALLATGPGAPARGVNVQATGAGVRAGHYHP